MSYQKHQESLDVFEDESNQPEHSDGLGEESAKKDQNKNPQSHNHAQSRTTHPDHDKRRLVSYFSMYWIGKTWLPPFISYKHTRELITLVPCN